MVLKVIIAFYLIVLLITAYYLWHNRNSHFLIFNGKTTSNFKAIMSGTAIVLFIECIIGLVILLQNNKYLNLLTLVFSSLTILIFSLLINRKSE